MGLVKSSLLLAMVLTVSLFTLAVYSQEFSFEGKYFVWEGDISFLMGREFVPQFHVRHKLYFEKFESSGASTNVVALISTEYYTPKTREQTRVDIYGVKMSFSNDDPLWVLHNESWIYKMNFIMSPFVIVNIGYPNISSFLLDYLVEGGVLGDLRDEYKGYYGGIHFDTWDVIVGTKRDLYYFEVYYQAVLLNYGEPSSALANSSVLEVDLCIDKELGIVLRERVFFPYSSYYVQISVELVDTNAFPKCQLYNTLIVMFDVIILLVILFVIYRRRKREKLIRI